MPSTTDHIQVKNQIKVDKIGFMQLVDLGQSLRLLIKDLKGKTHVIDTHVNALILSVKEQLADKTGMPVLAQRLTFQNKELADNKSISACGLANENVLDLQARLKGGMGELRAVEEFMQASIQHGNVRDLASKESKLALDVIRGNNREEYTRQVREKLVFNDSYKDNLQLQKLCARSLLVGKLKGGNCLEMADWTAVNLIENTSQQYVYICKLKGNFTLKDEIDQGDDLHPLYDADEQQVSSKLDHALVITYPIEETVIANMDTNKATVVDVWYNNLICSLEDYMATKHPYYNYEYAQENQLTLDGSKFEIVEYYPAVGTSFATDDSKTQANNKCAQIVHNIHQANQNFQANFNDKFAFDKVEEMREERSLESLEQLILQAEASNQLERELYRFNEAFLLTITKSENEQVLGHLYEAMEDEASYDQKLALWGGIVMAGSESLDRFLKIGSADYIESFHEDFVDLNADFYFDFIDKHLPVSNKKNKTLTSMPGHVFKQYTLSSPTSLQLVVAVAAVKDKLLNFLKHNTMKDKHWTDFYGLCTKDEAAAIINSLTQLDAATGQLAASKLPEDKK